MLDPENYITTKFELLVENLTHQNESKEELIKLLEKQIQDGEEIEAIYERQSVYDKQFIVLLCEQAIRILTEKMSEAEKAELIKGSQYLIERLANKTNTGQAIN